MSIRGATMRATKMNKAISITRLLLAAMLAMLLTATAYAAAPGITGPTFSLTAQSAYISQPDGQAIYSWGYGCTTGFTPTFAPRPGGADLANANCSTMQIPGPTLIVTEGQ